MASVHGIGQSSRYYAVSVNGAPIGGVQPASFTRSWAAEHAGQWYAASFQGFIKRSVTLVGWPYVLHVGSHLTLDGQRWLGLRRPFWQPRLEFFEPPQQPAGWLLIRPKFLGLPQIEAWVPDYVPPPAILLLVLAELQVHFAQQQAAVSST
jgi:hypothetical protein